MTLRISYQNLAIILGLVLTVGISTTSAKSSKDIAVNNRLLAITPAEVLKLSTQELDARQFQKADEYCKASGYSGIYQNSNASYKTIPATQPSRVKIYKEGSFVEVLIRPEFRTQYFRISSVLKRKVAISENDFLLLKKKGEKV